ncbi:MAG: hypothetical protein P8Y09_05260, partial [Deltaproteobacteria bacterium]
MAGGTAPIRAPGITAKAFFLFRWVYKPLYQPIANNPRSRALIPPIISTKAKPRPNNTREKKSAREGRMVPAGIGRLRVLS